MSSVGYGHHGCVASLVMYLLCGREVLQSLVVAVRFNAPTASNQHLWVPAHLKTFWDECTWKFIFCYFDTEKTKIGPTFWPKKIKKQSKIS